MPSLIDLFNFFSRHNVCVVCAGLLACRTRTTAEEKIDNFDAHSDTKKREKNNIVISKSLKTARYQTFSLMNELIRQFLSCLKSQIAERDNWITSQS